MKKLIVMLFITMAMCFTACDNNKDNSEKISDTIGNESPTGPAPDNSNATNPSLPDTAFVDSSRQH